MHTNTNNISDQGQCRLELFWLGLGGVERGHPGPQKRFFNMKALGKGSSKSMENFGGVHSPEEMSNNWQFN